MYYTTRLGAAILFALFACPKYALFSSQFCSFPYIYDDYQSPLTGVALKPIQKPSFVDLFFCVSVQSTNTIADDPVKQHKE